MKVAVILEYCQDTDKVRAIQPRHREYFRQFLASGELRAAGPLENDSGALWVLDVESVADAERIVNGDPFVAAGVLATSRFLPLAYWSAQEAKGSR